MPTTDERISELERRTKINAVFVVGTMAGLTGLAIIRGLARLVGDAPWNRDLDEDLRVIREIQGAHDRKLKSLASKNTTLDEALRSTRDKIREEERRVDSLFNREIDRLRHVERELAKIVADFKPFEQSEEVV